MPVITKTEVVQFYKKGFLIKKNLFKKKYIKIIQNEIQKLSKENNPNKVDKYYGPNIFNKKKNLLVRIENFYKRNKNLTKMIDSPIIKDILVELFKSKPTLFKEKINYKPSGCGPDKLHQDSQAGWYKYTKDFINVLVSIEKSTINNGCLKIDVSGNNCKRMIKKKMEPLKFKELNNPKFKNLLLGVGDVVLFNSFTPHYSNSNESKSDRSQIYLTYNKKKDGNFRSKYISDKRKTYPPHNQQNFNINKYMYKV